jgi:hypothetical protein
MSAHDDDEWYDEDDDLEAMQDGEWAHCWAWVEAESTAARQPLPSRSPFRMLRVVSPGAIMVESEEIR